MSRQKAVKKTALQEEEQNQIRSGYTASVPDEDATHVYVLLPLFIFTDGRRFSGGEENKRPQRKQQLCVEIRTLLEATRNGILAAAAKTHTANVCLGFCGLRNPNVRRMTNTGAP